LYKKNQKLVKSIPQRRAPTPSNPSTPIITGTFHAAKLKPSRVNVSWSQGMIRVVCMALSKSPAAASGTSPAAVLDETYYPFA
jgi:hypothetical protein